MTEDHVHFHSASGSGFSAKTRQDADMGTILHWEHARHPSDEYEALPDDAARPTEVTIRPRYEETTTVWVSAAIDDVVSLADHR